MTAMIVHCERCGARNEIEAANLVGNTDVACSHCHHLLGEWGALIEDINDNDNEKPTRR